MNLKFRSLILICIFLSSTLCMAQGRYSYTLGSDNPSCMEKCFHEKFLENNSKGVGDDYDLKYHRFRWTVDPAVCYISGNVTSYFVTKISSFSHVRFELDTLLTVDNVTYHGSNVTFTHVNKVLDINLGTTLTAGQLDSVTVVYHGNPGAGMGFGSFIQTTHNSVPVVWTLSEPYGASDWWPCKNILCDKIDSIDVFITTPMNYQANSNGILVGQTSAGPNKTYHWRHRYPIAAYLIAIAVTNYSIYTDKVPLGVGDTLNMINYVYPEDLAAAQSGTAAQVGVMQLFSNLFGPYPFKKEKYGQVEFGWGGGMEHQTASYVINFGFDLCAHEMAHQWYGDKVTCGSWHHIWVNEGFATYCQGLSTEYLNSYWWPTWKRDRINDITSAPDGSVYCTDTTDVNRVFSWRLSYEKGAMVLHMIRWIIGDSNFYHGMKNIIADPLLAYKYALTEDIQHHFETVSGMNLNEFFLDWIYREGYPTYTLNCQFITDSSVHVTISQTQSHPSVSYFELPVPIRFKNAVRDTVIVFNNTYSGQTYVVCPGFIPDSAFLDPDHWLLCKLDTVYTTVNVPEYQAEKLSVSPNPAEQFIIINNESGIQDIINIYDVTGRICLSVPGNSQNQMKLDVSGLQKGSYFIKLSGSGRIMTGKFIKS